MDVQSLSRHLYRYKFKDLKEKVGSKVFKPALSSKPLIAQVVVSKAPTRVRPPLIPQGIGELKHPITKKPDLNEVEYKPDVIDPVVKKDDSLLPESAFKYSAKSSYYKPSLSVRQNMEDEVRKRKKAGVSCPHIDKNNKCSALFIRCGARVQYAVPESLEQHNQTHTCLYKPKKIGPYILVIDRNKAFREFCRNTLELFFNYDKRKIVTAQSGHEAMKILNQFKMDGKICGLIICENRLPGFPGYEVVNQVYNRNYNTEIILTKEKDEKCRLPNNFKGLKEIIHHKTLVRKILTKPFHSEQFVKVLKGLDISSLF